MPFGKFTHQADGIRVHLSTSNAGSYQTQNMMSPDCFNVIIVVIFIIKKKIAADLGHSGSGAVPVSGRGVLPRRRLLRARLRRHGTEHLQDAGQLEGRVSDPGQPSRP